MSSPAPPETIQQVSGDINRFAFAPQGDQSLTVQSKRSITPDSKCSHHKSTILPAYNDYTVNSSTSDNRSKVSSTVTTAACHSTLLMSQSSDTINFEDHDDNLRQRIKVTSDDNTIDSGTGNNEIIDSEEEFLDDFNDDPNDTVNIKLSLMEEILLLGLKDKEGYTSFWNDNISTGLRGAIIVELALRQRIRLEKSKLRKRPLTFRKIICVDNSSTGDAVLDEALKHIKEHSGKHSVSSWIDFLSGKIIISFLFSNGIFQINA
ncbi:hypothetical protein GJ496_009566 [Pomphorhynchus laevis]|nr:hypothetical protein GJ496_009566 [Pomphorhynchus laevis]